MTGKTLRYCMWGLLALGGCVLLAFLAGSGPETGLTDQFPTPSGPGHRYSVESPIYLYFQDRESDVLVTEERMIVHGDTPVAFARTILDWLVKGPQHGSVRTMPPETVLRALHIHDGTAFVDFSREISDNHPGGALTEYLTVMSITNSLILNIQDIKRVKILIEGREQQTLAGHIELNQPFSANMMLVR